MDKKQRILLNSVLAYLHDSSWLCEKVVDCVDGDPHHGRERDSQTHELGPTRVALVTVSHSSVVQNVETKHALKKYKKLMILQFFLRIFSVFSCF